MIPLPEFIDCSICFLYLWVLSLPFFAAAAVSTLGDDLRRQVDLATHRHPHPLADRHNKAMFMAFAQRNPIGFQLVTFAGTKRLDYSLLRFQAAGTIVYVIYYVVKIL